MLGHQFLNFNKNISFLNRIFHCCEKKSPYCSYVLNIRKTNFRDETSLIILLFKLEEKKIRFEFRYPGYQAWTVLKLHT